MVIESMELLQLIRSHELSLYSLLNSDVFMVINGTPIFENRITVKFMRYTFVRQLSVISYNQTVILTSVFPFIFLVVYTSFAISHCKKKKIIRLVLTLSSFRKF